MYFKHSWLVPPLALQCSYHVIAVVHWESTKSRSPAIPAFLNIPILSEVQRQVMHSALLAVYYPGLAALEERQYCNRQMAATTANAGITPGCNQWQQNQNNSWF